MANHAGVEAWKGKQSTMKKPISEMTAEECQDELVFSAFERLLRQAKVAYNRAQSAEAAVFMALEDMCIDVESIPTDAENANNLGEAICCFLQHNEYSINGIMKEVRAAYGKQEREE